MTTDPGSIAFAAERFHWAAPDRLELTGRWTGVRGIRFVRPTLVLVTGDEHRRLLADLDDKPWPAEEGVPWSAAFPWTGDPLDAEAAELTVGPGMLVRLEAPELPAGGRARRLELESEHERLEREIAALRRERDDLLRLRDEAVRARNVVTRERDAAAVVRDRLERERVGLVEARDDLRHERDALRRRLEQLERRG